ncbi:cyst germination specific acidic repeat protein precursor [Cyclospora cayetanensis]|uniref:Cyst germination specific acidic repeat protein n=1 Tax=Cyclospora cayetanensis TaxID=88456 RepID=A0A1D3D4I1_9EIME|nr:cyst germination specific acidic repeat protein precursor [Cyclospora cayetanensis]
MSFYTLRKTREELRTILHTAPTKCNTSAESSISPSAIARRLYPFIKDADPFSTTTQDDAPLHFPIGFLTQEEPEVRDSTVAFEHPGPAASQSGWNEQQHTPFAWYYPSEPPIVDQVGVPFESAYLHRGYSSVHGVPELPTVSSRPQGSDEVVYPQLGAPTFPESQRFEGPKFLDRDSESSRFHEGMQPPLVPLSPLSRPLKPHPIPESQPASAGRPEDSEKSAEQASHDLLGSDAQNGEADDHAVEEPNEQTPQVPSEEKPEIPSEEQPEAPSEERPEIPSEEQPEIPSEEQPEAPSEEQAEIPSEEHLEAPSEEQPEIPSEEQPEAPLEEQPEAPSEEQPEAPSEEHLEAPSEEHLEAPSEEHLEAPSEEHLEAPSEEQPEAPSEEQPEIPSEEHLEAPLEEHFEAPLEEPSEEQHVSRDEDMPNGSRADRNEGSSGRNGRPAASLRPHDNNLEQHERSEPREALEQESHAAKLSKLAAETQKRAAALERATERAQKAAEAASAGVSSPSEDLGSSEDLGVEHVDDTEDAGLLPSDEASSTQSDQQADAERSESRAEGARANKPREKPADSSIGPDQLPSDEREEDEGKIAFAEDMEEAAARAVETAEALERAAAEATRSAEIARSIAEHESKPEETTDSGDASSAVDRERPSAFRPKPTDIEQSEEPSHVVSEQRPQLPPDASLSKPEEQSQVSSESEPPYVRPDEDFQDLPEEKSREPPEHQQPEHDQVHRQPLRPGSASRPPSGASDTHSSIGSESGQDDFSEAQDAKQLLLAEELEAAAKDALEAASRLRSAAAAALEAAADARSPVESAADDAHRESSEHGFEADDLHEGANNSTGEDRGSLPNREPAGPPKANQEGEKSDQASSDAPASNAGARGRATGRAGFARHLRAPN